MSLLGRQLFTTSALCAPAARYFCSTFIDRETAKGREDHQGDGGDSQMKREPVMGTEQTVKEKEETVKGKGQTMRETGKSSGKERDRHGDGEDRQRDGGDRQGDAETVR